MRLSLWLWSESTSASARRAWLWKWLGFGTAAATAVVVVHEALDPESATSNALHKAKERLSEVAARITGSAEHKALPPANVGRSPGSIRGYAARFLADWCSEPERSHLALALGGGPLLDWLLEAATECDSAAATDRAEQEQAQRALAFLLQSDSTAARVAERPGAVPRLLRYYQALLADTSADAAHPSTGQPDAAAPAAQLLSQALRDRAMRGFPTSDTAGYTTDTGAAGEASEAQLQDLSIARMMHRILGSSEANEPELGQGALFLADIEQVMDMMLQGSGQSVMDTVSGAFTPLQPAQLLVDIQQRQQAQQSTPVAENAGSHSAGQSSTQLLLQPPGPVYEVQESDKAMRLQQLCAAWLATLAEASASNRDLLTGLNVAAAVAQLTSQVCDASGSPVARALQLQLIRLVTALAQPTGSTLSDYLRSGDDSLRSSIFLPIPDSQERYTNSSRDTVSVVSTPSPVTAQHHLAGCLQPLLYITADAAVEQDSSRAVAALAALRALLLQGGQPVATAAATEPLLPFLKKIAQGNGPTELRGAAVQVLAAMAHTPRSFGDSPAVAETLADWRDWLLDTLCQDGKETSGQAELKQDCIEALTELARLPGTVGLQVTHYWLASLLASLATRVWPFNAVVYTGPKSQVILPRPAQDGDKGKAQDTAKPAGTAAQTASATADIIDARDFVDAVPVVPSQIAHVAALLEEASAAVTEEPEAPSDFDPASTAPAPLARSFKPKAPRPVDMQLAEQRVCEALEVLNALVAADPTKQKWLLTVGVLPLLHRLCYPSDPTAPLWQDQDTAKASKAETDDDSASTAPVNPVARWIGAAAASVGRSIASVIVSNMPASLKRSRADEEGAESQGAASATGSEAGQLISADVSRDPGAVELDLNDDHTAPTQLSLRRQVARLLALLAVQPKGRPQVEAPQWRSWLSEASKDADCRLASHATRALLNLAAFRPRARSGFSPHSHADSVAPVYLDQVHLLNPSASHLWTLAELGSTPRTGEILRAESTGALASTDIFAAAVQGGIGDYTAQLQTLRSDAAAAEAAIDPMAAPQTGPLTRMQELARTALGAVGSAMTLVAYASPGAVYLAPPGWDWHAPAEADSARTRATVCAAHDASTSQPSELLPPPDADAFSDTVIRDSQRDDTRYESASGMAAEGWAGSQASHAAGQQGGARPSLLAAALERAQSQSGLLPVAHARGLASTDHSAPHNLDPEPLIDVVFVHGIRGGPFITWRKRAAAQKGPKDKRRFTMSLAVSDCWPSSWLPEDVPRARLLTVEYHAPVSGWEGESLPLEATVERVMGQLQAAGVGQRPLVFITHSMGGLLVKEMLVRSMRALNDSEADVGSGPKHDVSLQGPDGRRAADRALLAQATRGIVFFATPHFGSGMAAMGWKLRHMPYAAPAPALAQLTPGPHLVELNETVRTLAETRNMRIVSAVEGQATQLSPVLPKVLIVPEASAWPGFGQLLPLPDDDHISLCKPVDRESPAYTVVLDVIRDALQYATHMAK